MPEIAQFQARFSFPAGCRWLRLDGRLTAFGYIGGHSAATHSTGEKGSQQPERNPTSSLKQGSRELCRPQNTRLIKRLRTAQHSIHRRSRWRATTATSGHIFWPDHLLTAAHTTPNDHGFSLLDRNRYGLIQSGSLHVRSESFRTWSFTHLLRHGEHRTLQLPIVRPLQSGAYDHPPVRGIDGD